MLLWMYPHGRLPDEIDFSIDIEADTCGVRVMVARDQDNLPHGVAVAGGDEPSDLGDVLAIWGLGHDDADEPPPEWLA